MVEADLPRDQNDERTLYPGGETPIKDLDPGNRKTGQGYVAIHD